MNEHTEKLVRDLAEKLGTTVEHLWGVLIRQAPISAAIDTALDLLMLAAAVFLLPWVFHRAKVIEDSELRMIFLIFAFLGWVTLACIFGSMALPALSTDMSGLFNPEYWALKQLLK